MCKSTIWCQKLRGVRRELKPVLLTLFFLKSYNPKKTRNLARGKRRKILLPFGVIAPNSQVQNLTALRINYPAHLCEQDTINLVRKEFKFTPVKVGRSVPLKIKRKEAATHMHVGLVQKWTREKKRRRGGNFDSKSLVFTVQPNPSCLPDGCLSLFSSFLTSSGALHYMGDRVNCQLPEVLFPPTPRFILFADSGEDCALTYETNIILHRGAESFSFVRDIFRRF